MEALGVNVFLMCVSVIYTYEMLLVSTVKGYARSNRKTRLASKMLFVLAVFR